MIFLVRPWIIVLLPFTILVILYIHRRSETLRKELAKTLQGRIKSGLLKPASTAMALAMLIIVLSQPVIYTSEKITINNLQDMVKYSSKLPLQYIILIDVSPSMHRGEPPLLETAVDIAKIIISNIRDNGTVILSVFGGHVKQLYVGPPFNASEIIDKVKNYDIEYTSIGDAIGYAVSCARASSLPSVAVIITDGANNYGPDPLKSYLYANMSRLPILFVRIDSDPRANKLFAELAKHGAHILLAEGFEPRHLEPVVKNVMQQLKYIALVESGKNYIVMHRVIGYPSMIAGILSLIAMVISKLNR